MKKQILKNLAVCSFLLVVISCGTKRNTFISRNFQTLTTKYNVLFNGKEAFKKGVKDIEQKHQDNFWKRLPIEPIEFKETEVKTPKMFLSLEDDGEKESKKLTTFDRAEEKAVKAIQKHSMNFEGYEKNRQIDDAYLLLGKSRYYTQRFIPAIEAFNYVITNYPNANLINETKIWKAKSNIRLENENLAIQSMKVLLEEEGEELSEEIKEQVHTTLAMAYEKTDTIQKVIEHLTKATQTFKNKEQTARNMFVLGQIYSELGRKDSARVVFNKIINKRKVPYKYKIHANIELVKNTNKKDSTSINLIKKFEKLVKDSDNTKYLDGLYYQLGVLEQNRDSVGKAIAYYEKSLKAKASSRYHKTYPYEKLGDVYFDKADYLVAGSYYDSVLKATPKEFEKDRRIRRIKRKSKGLKSLKEYELVVKTNDSILKLALMSDSEQKAYFEAYVAKLKKADEERKQQEQNRINYGNDVVSNAFKFQNNQSKGEWYFYNVQSLGFGKAEFKRVWGNRSLEDNWRFSDKSSDVDEETNKKLKIQDSKKYDVKTYLSTIPKNEKSIDSLKLQRNESLYQLGLIYKEQFKNQKLAASNFERLLKVTPDKKLELPITYHLYQIYKELENNEKANYYKNIVVTKYPDSRFAQIIQYPNKALVEKVDEVEKLYKEAYYKYKEDKYQETIDLIDNSLPSIQKSKLLPKFELLKAYSIGRIDTKECYLEALEFVAYSYANTAQGKKAKEIVGKLKE